MTTSHSPFKALKAQADTIARRLKELDSGTLHIHDPGGKVAAAKQRGELVFGIVQDDKLIKVTMPWAVIQGHTEDEISAWIVQYMQGRKETQQ